MCRRFCDRSSCGCGGCNSCSSGCGGYDYCDRPNVFGPFIFAFVAIGIGLVFLDGHSTQNSADPYPAPQLEQRW